MVNLITFQRSIFIFLKGKIKNESVDFLNVIINRASVVPSEVLTLVG